MGKHSSTKRGAPEGRRSLDKVRDFATSVGPGVHFQGRLSGSGHCLVLGTVEGDCVLDGVLVVGEGGRWLGDVEATQVLVAGSVEGRILAREKIEMAAGARGRGLLSAPAIAMARGAVHEGEVHTGAEGPLRFEERRQG